MSNTERQKRLRLLVRRANKERKKQAQQIDILCNDLISSQREFIKRLDTIGFAAHFYKSIVGVTDLNGLLSVAGELFKQEIPDANIAFFLREQDNFDLHMSESDQPITFEKQRIENCFTENLVETICRANKICTIDDMFAMGLQGNLTELNKISAVTIPLGRLGPSFGFILIYRSSKEQLAQEKISNVTSVTSGLSGAIETCRELLHSPN